MFSAAASFCGLGYSQFTQITKKWILSHIHIGVQSYRYFHFFLHRNVCLETINVTECSYDKKKKSSQIGSVTSTATMRLDLFCQMFLANRAILFHNLIMADCMTQEVGKFSKILLNKTMQSVFAFDLFLLLMFSFGPGHLDYLINSKGVDQTKNNSYFFTINKENQIFSSCFSFLVMMANDEDLSAEMSRLQKL